MVIKITKEYIDFDVNEFTYKLNKYLKPLMSKRRMKCKIDAKIECKHNYTKMTCTASCTECLLHKILTHLEVKRK